MKKVIITISSVVGNDGFNNNLYTYYVKFDGDKSYSYTIQATAEGFGNIISIMKEVREVEVIHPNTPAI